MKISNTNQLNMIYTNQNTRYAYDNPLDYKKINTPTMLNQKLQPASEIEHAVSSINKSSKDMSINQSPLIIQQNEGKKPIKAGGDNQAEIVNKMLEEHRKKKAILQNKNTDKENFAKYANNFIGLNADDIYAKMKAYQDNNQNMLYESKEYNDANPNKESILENNKGKINLKDYNSINAKINSQLDTKNPIISSYQKDISDQKSIQAHMTVNSKKLINYHNINQFHNYNNMNSNPNTIRNKGENQSNKSQNINSGLNSNNSTLASPKISDNKEKLIYSNDKSIPLMNTNNNSNMKSQFKSDQDINNIIAHDVYHNKYNKEQNLNSLPYYSTALSVYSLNKSNCNEKSFLNSNTSTLNSPINQSDRKPTNFSYMKNPNGYTEKCISSPASPNDFLNSKNKTPINSPYDITRAESRIEKSKNDEIISSKDLMNSNESSKFQPNSPKHIFLKLNHENIISSRKPSSSIANSGELNSRNKMSHNQTPNKTKSISKNPDKLSESLHWQIRQIKKLGDEMKLISPTKEINTEIKSPISYQTIDCRSPSELPGNQTEIRLNSSHIQEFDETLAKIESTFKLTENDKPSIDEKKNQQTERQQLQQQLDTNLNKSHISRSNTKRNTSRSNKKQTRYFEKTEESLRKKKELDNQFQNDCQKQSPYITYTNTPNRGKSGEELQSLINFDSCKTSESKNSKNSMNSYLSPLPSYSDLNRSITLRKINMEKLIKESDQQNDRKINRIFYEKKNIPIEQKKYWTELSLYDRNAIWLNAKSSKLNALQINLDNQEVKECTFQPYFHTKKSPSSMMWSSGNSMLKERATSSKSGSTSRSMIMGQSIKRRSKSICYMKKENISYSKFYELKKNLDMYKIGNNNNNRHHNNNNQNLNYPYSQRLFSYDSFDTIKISDVLNTVRNSNRELLA